MAQGHVDAAYVALAEAVRLQPRHVDALFFLSTLAKVMARQQYDRLYRIAPDSARVHQVMGESYVSQGDLPQAEAEYKTAIRMNPRLLAPLVGLADLKRENGAFQEAMPYYARALEANPSSFDANYGMGVCLVYLRRTEEALPYFRSALAVEQSSAVARFALGDALFKLGRLEPASKELREATRLEPAMRQGYVLLARVYQKLGRGNDAERAFARARELNDAAMDRSRASFANGTLLPRPRSPE